MEKKSLLLKNLLDELSHYSDSFKADFECDLEECSDIFIRFASHLNYLDACFEVSKILKLYFKDYYKVGKRFYCEADITFNLYDAQSLIDLAFELKHIEREFTDMYPHSGLKIIFHNSLDSVYDNINLDLNFSIYYDK